MAVMATPTRATHSYPDHFRRFIVRTTQHSLDQTRAADGLVAEEVRQQAWHTLLFALRLDEAWPLARDLLLALAPKLEQAGHRDDWLPYLEQGVAASQRCGDRCAEAELRLHIGHLYRLRSKFDLARTWLNASHDHFAGLGDDQGRARALNHLAFVAWQQRAYEEAKEGSEQALALLASNDPERASSFTTLGLVAFSQRELPKAEQYHRSALQIRREQGDQRRVAWSMQNLANALRDQGQYGEAIDYYKQAITVLEELADLGNCAIVQMNLGGAYSLDDQPSQALQIYSLAESTLRKVQDLHNLAKIYNNKGLNFLTLHDWQQAELAFLASITIAQEINDVAWQLNSLDGLGLAYLGRGYRDKATATFQTVINELPGIESTPMYAYLAKTLYSHLQQATQRDAS